MRNAPKQQISSVSTSTNRFAITVMGAIAGGLIVFLPMNNELLATLLAAAAGGIAALALDLLLIHKSLRRAPRLAIPRLIVGLIVGGLIGNWFRLDPRAAFEMAFNTKPSAAVQNLRSHGSFLGKQNNTILYIEFQADRATIDAIVSSASLERSVDMTKSLQSPAGWQNTWEYLFPEQHLFPDAIGLGNPIAGEPVQFDTVGVYQMTQKTPINTSIRLVWDEATGQAIARFARIQR